MGKYLIGDVLKSHSAPDNPGMMVMWEQMHPTANVPIYILATIMADP